MLSANFKHEESGSIVILARYSNNIGFSVFKNVSNFIKMSEEIKGINRVSGFKYNSNSLRNLLMIFSAICFKNCIVFRAKHPPFLFEQKISGFFLISNSIIYINIKQHAKKGSNVPSFNLTTSSLCLFILTSHTFANASLKTAGFFSNRCPTPTQNSFLMTFFLNSSSKKNSAKITLAYLPIANPLSDTMISNSVKQESMNSDSLGLCPSDPIFIKSSKTFSWIMASRMRLLLKQQKLNAPSSSFMMLASNGINIGVVEICFRYFRMVDTVR